MKNGLGPGNGANGYVNIRMNKLPCHEHRCAPLPLQAIYSIFKTESEMVEDLKMVIIVRTVHVYLHPDRVLTEREGQGEWLKSNTQGPGWAGCANH